MSNIEPGSWETDEKGRRFRRVGPGCIEYPMTVSTPYGEFEVGHVPIPQRIAEPDRLQSWGSCPFVSKCSPKCARYSESGCGLVTGKGPTVGMRCPFGDKTTPARCTEDCALWTLCNRRKENS